MFKVGDLVKYKYHVNEPINGISKWTPKYVHGRLVGKFSESWSSNAGMTSQAYAIKLFIPSDLDILLPPAIKDVLEDFHDYKFSTDDIVEGKVSKKEKKVIVSPDFWIIKVKISDVDKNYFKDIGVCKFCAHKGEWISLALLCPYHGKIAG